MAPTPRERSAIKSDRQAGQSRPSGLAEPLEEPPHTRKPDKWPSGSYRKRYTSNLGAVKNGRTKWKSDIAITEAALRVGRIISEDFPGIDQYVSELGEGFQGMTRCQVYMATTHKSTREDSPASLERRIDVYHDGKEWRLAEDPGIFIDEGDVIFQVFAKKTPIVLTTLDGKPVRVVFNNMDLNDDGYEILEGRRPREGNSIAMMPFYYRVRGHASGIAVFEGDLRCRDSEITGFDQIYWSARVAMAMAAQISYKLTHEIDAITSLRKLKDFQLDMETGIVETVRRGDELCLIFIDLDEFGKINKKVGWPGGNAALEAVAQVIKDSVRAEDCAARYGGDEFAIILRNVLWAEALEISDRIINNIKTLRIPHDGTEIRPSCSMGVVNIKRVVEEMGYDGIQYPTEEQINEISDQVFRRSSHLVLAVKDSGKGKVLSA